MDTHVEININRFGFWVGGASVGKTNMVFVSIIRRFALFGYYTGTWDCLHACEKEQFAQLHFETEHNKLSSENCRELRRRHFQAAEGQR